MQPMVIGIAGGSGSGKSTLVRAVVDSAPVRCTTLAFDNYYRDQGHLTSEERTKVNYDHPNSLDVEQFTADLTRLRSGNSFAAPVYDFTTHTRSSDIELVDPEPIVLVDGILLLVFDEICELLDIAVFVDVSDDLRTERRVARDIAERGRTREGALAQIDRTVRPMHGEFVQPSKERADIVIDGTVDPSSSASRVLASLPVSVA